MWCVSCVICKKNIKSEFPYVAWGKNCYYPCFISACTQCSLTISFVSGCAWWFMRLFIHLFVGRVCPYVMKAKFNSILRVDAFTRPKQTACLSATRRWNGSLHPRVLTSRGRQCSVSTNRPDDSGDPWPSATPTFINLTTTSRAACDARAFTIQPTCSAVSTLGRRCFRCAFYLQKTEASRCVLKLFSAVVRTDVSAITRRAHFS